MKIRVSLTALFAALFAFAAFMPLSAYAANSKDKADEINAAGRNSVQSQSATESRSINNAAWDGASQGGGTPSAKGGQTIDIMGGNASGVPEDEKSSFDAPESEDVTPWKELLTGLVSTFMAATGLLAAAAAILGRNGWAGNKLVKEELLSKIGIALAIAALAAFTSALALATVLMIKYKQYVLGSIWASGAALGIADCVFTIAYGRAAYKRWFDNRGMHRLIMALGLLTAAIGLGGGGYLAYHSFQQTDQQQDNQDKKTSSSSAQVLNYRIG